MKPVAALGGTLVVIVLATARVALAVECGDVITEDTVLLADVGPCADQGVQVVGPATLDLNGHAIRGLGRGPDHCVGLEGEGATLKNGTISSCEQGVTVSGQGEHLLTQLRLTDTGTGFRVSSDGNRLLENVSSGSTAAGFRVTGWGNRLKRNVAIGNGSGFLVGGKRNVLAGNSATGQSGEGFVLDDSAWKHRLIDNLAVANGGQGLAIAGVRHRVLRNRAIENGGEGIALVAFRTLVAENFAVRNNTTDLLDTADQCGDNVWRANVFDRKSQDCIE